MLPVEHRALAWTRQPDLVARSCREATSTRDVGQLKMLVGSLKPLFKQLTNAVPALQNNATNVTPRKVKPRLTAQ